MLAISISMIYFDFKIKDDPQIIPSKDDPPLYLAAPMPTRANAHSGSPFGFEPNFVKNPSRLQESRMVTRRIQEDEVVLNSELDVEATQVEKGFVAMLFSFPAHLFTVTLDTIEDMNVDQPIDEQSPDEDEEQAMRLLQASYQRNEGALGVSHLNAQYIYSHSYIR